MLKLTFIAIGSSGVASGFKCSISLCTNFGLRVGWDISKAKTFTCLGKCEDEMDVSAGWGGGGRDSIKQKQPSKGRRGDVKIF